MSIQKGHPLLSGLIEGLFIVVLLCMAAYPAIADSQYERTVIYQLPAASYPTGVVMDASGDYIVSESILGTNSWDDALSRIHENARNVIYSSPTAMDLYDVAIDSGGNFYVAEYAGTGAVTKLDPYGNVMWKYDLGGDWSALGLTVDTDDGCVFYAADSQYNQYIGKYSSDGTELLFEYAIPVQWRGNGDVVVDHEGNYILVTGADSSSATGGDGIYGNADGALLKIYRNGGGLFDVIYHFNAGSLPIGVAIDDDSNYIITETGTNALIKITPASEKTTLYQFDSATGVSHISLDSEGNVLVSECLKDIISRISPVSTNQPPSLEIPSETPTEVNEGETLTFSVTGTDPENQPVIISVQDLPAGATFTGNQFSWTPGFDQAGIYGITFIANDGELTTTVPFTLTVKDVNQAPILDEIGNKEVIEGNTLQFAVSAHDPEGSPLCFTATGLPKGASFNTVTRVFKWTPLCSQTGQYSVSFEVSDGFLSDSEVVTIEVKPFDSTAAISEIITKVEDSNLPHGIQNSLIIKLNNAKKMLEKDHTQVAIKQLTAFISEVRAQKCKKIPKSLADELIKSATQIINHLRCLNHHRCPK